MNLPTKLTVSRIVLSIIIIIIMCFPFHFLNIDIPSITLAGSKVTVEIGIDYIISGVLFLIASLTDFLDGYLARKNGQITDTGKMLDAIADKVLVNSVLIILAAKGDINAVIPVVIVIRDIIVNAIKMEAASKGKVVAAIKSGKIKTASLMVGVVLMFARNVPFEFIEIKVADVFLWFATFMSIFSLIQYYNLNKNIIFGEKSK